MKHSPPLRERGCGLIVTSAPTTGTFRQETSRCPDKGGLGASHPTTKAAIVHMSKWVGNELRGDHITVVRLSPGYAR